MPVQRPIDWFNDGREKTVDFTAWLQDPAFAPLKEPAYFQRFFVEAGTVSWPNGADITPRPSTRLKGWKYWVSAKP